MRSKFCTNVVITCAVILYVEGIKLKVCSYNRKDVVVNLAIPKTPAFGINRDDFGLHPNFPKFLL